MGGQTRAHRTENLFRCCRASMGCTLLRRTEAKSVPDESAQYRRMAASSSCHQVARAATSASRRSSSSVALLFPRRAGIPRRTLSSTCQRGKLPSSWGPSPGSSCQISSSTSRRNSFFESSFRGRRVRADGFLPWRASSSICSTRMLYFRTCALMLRSRRCTRSFVCVWSFDSKT